MSSFFKTYLKNMFDRSVWLNQENIRSSIYDYVSKDSKVLDVGCDTGYWISKIRDECQLNCAHGVEIRSEAVMAAINNGVIARQANIDETGIPFDDNFFDVVTSNQVIEHVSNIDHFASEVSRVTRTGGLIVISTENLSSWHNVLSVACGWQPFSGTNISAHSLGGLGNPMAYYRGVAPEYKASCHKTLFAYLAFKEFWESHGFGNVKIIGSGYFPFPARFGVWEPRHAHFITATAYKL